MIANSCNVCKYNDIQGDWKFELFTQSDVGRINADFELPGF